MWYCPPVHGRPLLDGLHGGDPRLPARSLDDGSWNTGASAYESDCAPLPAPDAGTRPPSPNADAARSPARAAAKPECLAVLRAPVGGGLAAHRLRGLGGALRLLGCRICRGWVAVALLHPDPRSFAPESGHIHRAVDRHRQPRCHCRRRRERVFDHFFAKRPRQLHEAPTRLLNRRRFPPHCSGCCRCRALSCLRFSNGRSGRSRRSTAPQVSMSRSRSRQEVIASPVTGLSIVLEARREHRRRKRCRCPRRLIAAACCDFWNEAAAAKHINHATGAPLASWPPARRFSVSWRQRSFSSTCSCLVCAWSSTHCLRSGGEPVG